MCLAVLLSDARLYSRTAEPMSRGLGSAPSMTLADDPDR